MSKSKRREMEAAAAVEAEVMEEVKTAKKTSKKKVEEAVKEEKKPVKKAIEKTEKPTTKEPAKASSSSGEPFERKLRTMTTKELTEALYEYSKISFEWQARTNDHFDDHDQKIDDHEKRIKALEKSTKPEEPKPEPAVKPEEPKSESAKVRVQPLVKNEPKLEGIRFPYTDGPCNKLWLWWNADGKCWCGPTDIHTADKLSAKVPEKAFVWIGDGKVKRFLTDKEIAEYFG